MGVNWEVDKDGNPTGGDGVLDTLTVDSITINDTPALASDAARKDYVDALITGVDWQPSVKSRFDPTAALPVGPVDGDRYISTTTNILLGWTQDYIYEYNAAGLSWTETIPNAGFAAYVEDELTQYVYSGVTWVTLSSTTDHNLLSTLQGGAASEYYHFNNASYTWLQGHTTNNGNDHSFIDQDVKVLATPEFAGLTLTGFSGVVYAAAGILAAGDIDNVADSATYGKVKVSSLTTGEVAKVTDAAGDDMTVSLGTTDRILTLGADVALDQDVKILSNVTFASTSGDITADAITFGESLVVNTTDVNVAAYTVLSTDYFLHVRRTSTGICNCTLPSIASVGDGFVLKIKDSGYNCGTSNITLTRDGADKIENFDGNHTMNIDGECLELVANTTTSNWEIA